MDRVWRCAWEWIDLQCFYFYFTWLQPKLPFQCHPFWASTQFWYVNKSESREGLEMALNVHKRNKKYFMGALFAMWHNIHPCFAKRIYCIFSIIYFFFNVLNFNSAWPSFLKSSAGSISTSTFNNSAFDHHRTFRYHRHLFYFLV